MSLLKVDLALVAKYNVPGPRYTSYPPATHFSDKVTFDSLGGLIRANNETERDLSLYFHLPFCYSLCWFCGCTTVITTQQGQSGTYIGYLGKEMELMGRLLNPRRKVVQLHFGGGTPTFLLPDEIRRLGEMIRSGFTWLRTWRLAWRLIRGGWTGTTCEPCARRDSIAARWECRTTTRGCRRRCTASSPAS